MHEAQKRVHDRLLVKHLPGRNHKANMVHLEGCCRERCAVGSTSQARVFIPPRTTAKTLVVAGHVGLQEFIA